MCDFLYNFVAFEFWCDDFVMTFLESVWDPMLECGIDLRGVLESVWEPMLDFTLSYYIYIYYLTVYHLI